MSWYDSGDIVVRLVRAAPNPLHQFEIVLVLAPKHRPLSYKVGSALDGLLRSWSKQRERRVVKARAMIRGYPPLQPTILLFRGLNLYIARVNSNLPVVIKLSSKTASSSVMAVLLVHTTTRFLAAIHGNRSLYNRVTPGSYDEKM